MTSYDISFKPSVQKDLRSIPKEVVLRILERIEELRTDQFPQQAVKLSGAERLYRLRVGEYRIIYEVDSKNQQIIIHYVRHRRDAYRAL